MNLARLTPGKGLDVTPGCLKSGQNSGYQAMNLAYHFGVSRILLMGYDMQHTGGKAHWHGDHPRGLGNAQRMQRYAEHFPYIAKDLESEGVEVVNCSRETALTCFERANIREVL